jgi:hypothetical protein
MISHSGHKLDGVLRSPQQRGQAKHLPSNVADKLMTFNSATTAPIIVIVLWKDSSIAYTELCLTARAAFLLQRMSIG